MQAKHAFEHFAHGYGVKIKSYRADNKPFRDKLWTDDMSLQEQTATYSGVGAHFQNGVAERAVQTVTLWALTLMMHQLLHWPEQYDESLWPFAMQHAVTLWNYLPKSSTRLSPIEIFTGTTVPDHTLLLHSRIWGCPVYVLDPRLQDGKNLPKWHKHPRQGMYLGVSSQHSSTVGLVLNLNSGAISPQYHLVYDKLFTSVHGHPTSPVFDEASWRQLLTLGGEENTLIYYNKTQKNRIREEESNYLYYNYQLLSYLGL